MDDTMNTTAHKKLIQLLNSKVKPVTEQHFIPDILEQIGESRVVLIGEASHGTQEFYARRAQISKALIQQKGFMAVAIEGDWPSVYQLNEYVLSQTGSLDQAWQSFKRFPQWMWRNEPMEQFLQWLKKFNLTRNGSSPKIGVYGLDLYSLYPSINALLNYLSTVDPQAADRARLRFDCFNRYVGAPEQYGLVAEQHQQSCIEAIKSEVLEMQYEIIHTIKNNKKGNHDAYYSALQNAFVIKDAEAYYRSLYDNHISSWNVRDQHMAESLQLLMTGLEERHQVPAKIIIWAHNSHLGDARATEMSDRGEINLGQLIKERHGAVCHAIGFSTYAGSVTAASHWGGATECKTVLPALAGSYEFLFNQLQYKEFILNLTDQEIAHYLKLPMLQRAIGVVYLPETERQSHYYFARLAYQFETMIHIDYTTNLKALAG